MLNKIFLSLSLFSLCCLLATSARAQSEKRMQEQIEQLLQEKNSRTPAQQKISSQLLQAIRERRGQKMAQGTFLSAVNVNAGADGKVMIDIRANVTETLLASIKTAGGIIESSFPFYKALRIKISLSAVEAIAALPGIIHISPAARSFTNNSSNALTQGGNLADEAFNESCIAYLPGSSQKLTNMQRREKIKQQVQHYFEQHSASAANFSGSVTSEGDHAHRADDARTAFGAFGSGVRIGVLSDSYNARGTAESDVLSGNLPGTGNPNGYLTPVTVVEDYYDSYSQVDEGRAMLQIIHDIAPAAQLYFATAFTGEAGFASNILTLRNTYNCDIIIDDVNYTTDPTFQDGVLAQAVNTVTAAGALYFSSAGNSGNVAKNTAGVFEGDFNDAGSLPFSGTAANGTIHNFGTVAAPVNGDIITLKQFNYYLTWSDSYYASANDYDLFVVSASGNVKSSSTDIQNGDDLAFETLYQSTFAAGDRLVVFKKAGAAIRAFALNTFGGKLTNFTTGQIRGHSAAAAAFAVAATSAQQAAGNPFTSSALVENYTSDGLRRMFRNADGSEITPGNVLFGTNGGTLRNKPDLTGADGVSTTLQIGVTNVFYGTSAAASHAGAIAGLLKSAKPSITPAEVRTALTTTALDIESPGYDNVSGFGIVQAYQAMQSLNVMPQANVSLANYSIAEGAGSNSNGAPDPGETISFTATLQNNSALAASNVSATLTTSTAGITIVPGSSAYGAIAPGTTVTNSTSPFSFTIASAVPCGTVINFTVTVTFTGSVTTTRIYPVTVKVSSQPQITIISNLGTPGASTANFTSATGTQTGRLNVTSPSSICGTLKANPGLLSSAGSRTFDSYRFTNTGSTTKCYTATLAVPNGAMLFIAAYNNAGFVPANPSTNFLAGPESAGGGGTFSFNVLAGQSFTLVVSQPAAGTSNATLYNIFVSSLGCGNPVPANDNCVNATSLVCNAAPISGTTTGTVAETTGNGFSSAYGVWYKLAGDGSEVSFTSVAASGFNHEVDVFTGSCGALTALFQTDIAGAGGTEKATFTTVNGTIYYFYIAQTTTTSTTTGNFNFSVTCESCGTPTATAATFITPVSANANWTPITGTFIIEYGLSSTFGTPGTGAAAGNVNNTVVTAVNVGAKVLMGLTPVKNYSYVVRKDCTAAGQGYSNNSNTITFNTPGYPPSNDNCTAATPFPTIPADGTCANLLNQSTQYATSSGVTANPACQVDGGYDDDDVWFSFVAPAPSLTLGYANVSGNITITTEVFSGGCGASMTTITCIKGVNGYINGLTAGQTYYMRLYTYDAAVYTVQNICLRITPSPPSNDNCSGAKPFPAIPIDGSCAVLPGQSTAGGTNSNVTPGGACTSNAGNPDDDVWFSFVASAATLQLQYTHVSGSTDIYTQVLSGNCGSTMTSIICTDTDAGIIIPGLTVGQTYFIRLYTYHAFEFSVQDICLKTPPPPPSNDNCINATPFPAVPTDGTCAILSNQSTQYATNSTVTPTGSCTSNSGSPDDDVWFSFVATAPYLQLQYTYVSGSTDIYSQVFTGNCGSSMTSVFCFDNDDGITLSGLTVGQTYYLRMYTYFSTNFTVQNICIKTPPAGQANDNCINATAFPVIPTNGTCVSLLNQSTLGATNSNVTPAGACTANSGTPDDDIWFTFVAPASTVLLQYTRVSGEFNIYTQVFSGSCGSVMNSKVCLDNDAGGAITGLIPGQIYFIRMYTFGIGVSTVQNICLKTPTGVPVNDEVTEATNLVVGAGCTGAPYTNVGATLSPNERYPSCSGNGLAPVWFKFTATSPAVKISTDYSGGTLTDTKIALFSAGDINDYSTFNIISCDEDNGVTVQYNSIIYATGLTPNTTYYIAADNFDEFTSPGTFCITVDNLQSDMLSATNTCSSTFQFPEGFSGTYKGQTPFADAAGKLVAIVQHPAGGSPENYTAKQNVFTGAVRQLPGGQYYLNRSWLINNFASATNVNVQLFFTDAELAALTAADPTITLSTLAVIKQTGTTCSANYNTAGANTTLQALSSGSQNGVDWITVNTPSFSNFYITKGIGVVPVKIEFFTGVYMSKGNLLDWKISCTGTPYVTTELQRSNNATTFSTIYSETATAVRCNEPFSFLDAARPAVINYYRVKMTDANGRVTFSKLISLLNKQQGAEITGISPNPVRQITTLNVSVVKKMSAVIRLTDMSGRTVFSRKSELAAGANQVGINMAGFAAGTYQLIVVAGEETLRSMLIVKE